MHKHIIVDNTPKKSTETKTKKWAIFTFHSPIIQVINIFRDTNLKITFRTNNTLQSILNTRQHNKNTYTQSGVYKVVCHTCSNSYIGQTGTGRTLDIRYILDT
jgi:hypothetical protein